MKPYASKYMKVRDHRQTRCIHCGRWVDLLREKTCPKCGKRSLARADKRCCDDCHTRLTDGDFVWPFCGSKQRPIVELRGLKTENLTAFAHDLICLLGTRAEKEVVRLIREQLDTDLAALERRKNGDVHAHISLCAKWMPSSNASSARTRGNAKVLMRLLKLNEKQYRAILTPLRAAISLTEHAITRRQFDRINYDHVPSQALLRYDCLFSRFDHDRYEAFMRAV